MPTLRPEELTKLMHSLVISNLSLPTRCLIEWQLLTLVRPSEASGTRWEGIDFDAKLWIIPAGRMKAKREHVVPLSPQALDILERMKSLTAIGSIFFLAEITQNKQWIAKQLTLR